MVHSHAPHIRLYNVDNVLNVLKIPKSIYLY